MKPSPRATRTRFRCFSKHDRSSRSSKRSEPPGRHRAPCAASIARDRRRSQRRNRDGGAFRSSRHARTAADGVRRVGVALLSARAAAAASPVRWIHARIARA
jgi:hypothetical protein